MNNMELDKSGLDNRIFDAFAQTSERTYVYMCNMQTNVSRWSHAAVAYFGLPGEYMLNAGDIWEEHIHPDDRQAYHDNINDLFCGRIQRHAMDYRARTKDGDYVMCTCRGIVLKGENGEPDIFAGTMVNHGIVENVDAVTNLYNGYEFLRAMNKLINEKKRAYVLMIGIDHFHNVNYIYGYDYGNIILHSFAAKLKTITHGIGTVYRMDGSRFAVCLNDIPMEQIKELYNRIRSMGNREICVKGANISLGIAGGVFPLGNSNVSEYTIRSCATEALMQSKHNRHGELVFFRNSIHGSIDQTLMLFEAIRRDIVAGCSGFYLVYQPIIDSVSGNICGAEALIRWRSKDSEIVSPDRFIDFLENDTCFYELGSWILERAMTEFRPLLDKNPQLVLNVNISYVQLEHSGFRDLVLDVLNRTQFPPQNLCLELTERCKSLNLIKLKEEMLFFQHHGIEIALDDFGTGASSLNLLRDLPVNLIKVDRAFVSNILTNLADKAILESVIQCSHKLDVRVCIEGVENKQIHNFIEKYRAEEYQGFYFSRPVSVNQFSGLICKERVE